MSGAGVPEPRANPELLGHDAPAGELTAAARSGRLHHAWLLTGPEGVGKATLAYRFARWLLAGRPPGATPLAVDPDNPAFRRVAAGAHADLLTVEPGTAQGTRKRGDVVNIDAVRLIPGFLALTPAEGGWRVVVLDGADTMQAPAANTLLKVLEEPPPRAVLLLTAAAPGRLLPTIRSRCRRLDLAPLPVPELDTLLDRWLPGQARTEREALHALSDGAPGRALALSAGSAPALQRTVEEVLAALPRPDPRTLDEVADRVAAGRDAATLVTFFALLRRALAAATRQAARGAAAAPWLAGRSLAEWSAVWESLGALADESERLNLDRKGAVLQGLGLLAAPR